MRKLQVLLRHLAVIVSDYASASVFNRKICIQVRSNSARQLFFVHKDENARLRLYRERRHDKAFIVSKVLDVVENFVSGIDGVGSVRRDVDTIITSPQKLLLDSSAYMRRERGRQQCPAHTPRKDGLQFIQTAPGWTKCVEAIVW